MNFLGVLLDNRVMMIELLEQKIIELKRILSNLITKDKITKRQFQVCLFADCWIAFLI